MQICCRDAPIISIENSCDIYCNTLNQTTEQLMQCLTLNFGANKGNSAGILCSLNSAAGRLHSASKTAILVTMLLGIGSLTNSLL
jgi:hypothetical protein